MGRVEEQLKLQQGCRYVGLAILVCGVLAWWLNPWFILPLVAVAVGWIVICQRKAGRDRDRLDREFAKAYEDFDAPKPELQVTSSYGYPHFSVIFQSREDMQRARTTGHTDTFRAWILENYGFRGFDINRGFSTLYLGWEKESLEVFKVDPTGKLWQERTTGWTAGDSDEPV